MISVKQRCPFIPHFMTLNLYQDGIRMFRSHAGFVSIFLLQADHRWPSVEPHKSEKYWPPQHKKRTKKKKQVQQQEHWRQNCFDETGSLSRRSLQNQHMGMSLTTKLCSEYFSHPYPVHHRLQNTSCVWFRNEYHCSAPLIPRRLKSGCMDKHCSVEFCCGRFWLLDKEIYAGIGIGWSMTASRHGNRLQKRRFPQQWNYFPRRKKMSVGKRNGWYQKQPTTKNSTDFSSRYPRNNWSVFTRSCCPFLSPIVNTAAAVTLMGRH